MEEFSFTTAKNKISYPPTTEASELLQFVKRVPVGVCAKVSPSNLMNEDTVSLYHLLVVYTWQGKCCFGLPNFPAKKTAVT